MVKSEGRERRGRATLKRQVSGVNGGRAPGANEHGTGNATVVTRARNVKIFTEDEDYRKLRTIHKDEKDPANGCSREEASTRSRVPATNDVLNSSWRIQPF